jgi:hypothetical protein
VLTFFKKFVVTNSQVDAKTFLKNSFSHKICLGQLLAAFSLNLQQYGHKFSTSNNCFLWPVLSYFAEFSAGWQPNLDPE